MRRTIGIESLPFGFRASAGDGLVAEFWPDGHLKRFARSVGGSTRDHWALELDEHEEAGRAICENGYGGSPDYELYRAGKYEVFDAFSDNSRPEARDFVEWARRWIKVIAQNITP
jgi:hypothetical protein